MNYLKRFLNKISFPFPLLFFSWLFFSGTMKAQYYAPYGGPFTPQGDIKFLMIFAGFENEGCKAENDPEFSHGMWPSIREGQEDCKTFPLYTDDFFYSDTAQFYKDAKDKSISNFYYQMSRHSDNPLRITADIFPERINIKGSSANSRAVFQQIQEKYPDFDWSRYDQRKNNPAFRADYSSNNPDYELDYVVIIWRQKGSSGYASISPFTFTTRAKGKIEKYKITSGFTIERGMWEGSQKKLFHHELAHSLFNCPHIFNTNGVHGSYFYASNGWGTMSYGLINSSTNAWESWYNGWIELPYDLSDYTHNGTYTLRDFISTGDAMRIQLPFSNQRLWIENHAGISIFDEREGFTSNASGAEIPPSDKGLYMFVENIAESRSAAITPLSLKVANGLKALHANGNYDYEVIDYNLKDRNWWGNIVVDFKLKSSNPASAHNDVAFIRANYGFDTSYPDKIIYRKFTNNRKESCQMCESCNGAFPQEAYGVLKKNGIYTYNELGIGMAFGNAALPQKIGMSSNPMIINHQRYNCPDKLEPIYLHGVSITILSKAPNGDITFQVRFEDTEINTDHTFTGDLVLNDIGNAQFDLHVMEKKTLTLDNSGTPNRYNKGELINGEYEFPDFVNPSLLTLEAGSKTLIEDQGVLLVKRGTTLWIKSGAELSTKGKGRVKVEEGAFLFIEPGAIVKGNSINLHKKATAGMNPKLHLSFSSCLSRKELKKKR